MSTGFKNTFQGFNTTNFNDVNTAQENVSLASALVSSLKKVDHDEIDDLASHFNQRISAQKSALDDWFKLQGEVYGKYQDFKREYEQENSKAQTNKQRFLEKVERGDLIRPNYTLDLEKEFEGTEYENMVKSEWFQAFKNEQSQEFVKLAHDLAKKMAETRYTDAVQDSESTVSQSIEKNMSSLDKCKQGNTDDKINPLFKHYLTDLAKSINEKQKIDNVIPQILKDLNSKPSEYAKEMTPLIKEFSTKLLELRKSFEQNLYKDSGNRGLYTSIDKEDPQKVRTSMAGFNITSGELASLQAGKPLTDSIILFYLTFLREKASKLNTRAGDDDKIYIADRVFDIYKGEGLLYSMIGKDSSILSVHKRVGFLIAVDDAHLILVEIKKTEKDHTKELIIYNSSVKHYEVFHNKIYGVFRSCIGYDENVREDIRMNQSTQAGFGASRTSFKTGENFGKTLQGTKTFTRAPQNNILEMKVANAPQQLNPYESAVYALKNATLLLLDRKIMQGSYTHQDANLFRYEIFNNIIKAGVSNSFENIDIE